MSERIPKIFTPKEEKAMDALTDQGDEVTENGDPETGDALWGDSRDIASAALVRGGATWENANRTIEFDNEGVDAEDVVPSIVAASPYLSPTAEQKESLRREMEEDMAESANETEDGEGDDGENATEAQQSPTNIGKDPNHRPGYVPTFAERVRSWFGK